jgi:Pyruvate/2-oxoacid:ferredoxin oxidoreductase delta subunit
MRIDAKKCVGCGICMTYCPVGEVIALDDDAGHAYLSNALLCGGCYMCLKRCPNGAIIPVAVVKDGFYDTSKPEIIAPGQARS